MKRSSFPVAVAAAAACVLWFLVASYYPLSHYILEQPCRCTDSSRTGSATVNGQEAAKLASFVGSGQNRGGKKNNRTDNTLQRLESSSAIAEATVEDIIPSRMTFVTGRFSADPKRFVDVVSRAREAAIGSGWFAPSNVFAYSTFPNFVTANPAFRQHLTFLRQPRHASHRGAGYWFWKPLLIQHHLRLIQDGDFLVYLDADEAIGHVPFVKTLVRNMLSRQDQNANFIARILPHRQGEWTKRDVYETHCPGVNPYTDPWMQLEGGRFVIRKDAATVALIDSWAALVADYHLLSDEPSVQVSNGETRFFNEHRHDQSLLNVALACSKHDRFDGRTVSARIVPGTPTPIDLCVETKRHVDEANATRAIWTSESKMLYCEISPYVSYSISLEV